MTDFHGRIMNIRMDHDPDYDPDVYKHGHRDARHAAAEIAVQADVLIAELVAALEDIAKQKKTTELETEYDVECADFEGGYDACIDVARAALAKAKEAT